MLDLTVPGEALQHALNFGVPKKATTLSRVLKRFFGAAILFPRRAIVRLLEMLLAMYHDGGVISLSVPRLLPNYCFSLECCWTWH